MPGTSLGVKEVEKYLNARNHKQNRHAALQDTGINKAHSFNIDKSFNAVITRIKALFPYLGDNKFCGLPFIYSCIGQTYSPILDFNLFCLKNKVNCVFFSRYNILRFKTKKSSTLISLNNGDCLINNKCLDSS
jgi:hypothetical protein